jgi:alpha-aminoadipate carrier protein LysW
MSCIDCGATIKIPKDAIEGEIVGCPDCGLDYVATKEDSGVLKLQELTIEGEDWGE